MDRIAIVAAELAENTDVDLIKAQANSTVTRAEQLGLGNIENASLVGIITEARAV